MLFAVLIASVVVLVYFFNQYKHSYWSRHGFKQLDPKFFYGDAKRLLSKQCSMGEYLQEVYTKCKTHRIVGIYVTYNPMLVVTDPKLVQDIMIRDFNSFHDRPMTANEEYDPLSGHLFMLKGQKWRDLRVKLSPTFTSGKLKGMFPVIRDCGEVLETYLKNKVNGGENIFEFRDLMSRYSLNIISSVAFGIENDCINEPDHIFKKMGEKIFEKSKDIKHMLGSFLAVMLPGLHSKLKLKMLSPDVEKFIFSIVRQTIDYREQNNISRNDFMQLLIQLKNQGYVSADREEKEAGNAKANLGNLQKLDLNSLAAQVFSFFAAGFETSSSTMSYALFEIARNINVQKNIQEEIDKVFKAAGPEGITYEMLGELKYLELVIEETLRKYPIVPLHFRTASRDYNIAGTNLIIPKDSSIFIPALGFHRDPEIYENPMEFKPERFLNSSNGSGNAEGVFYTPFGDGPRNCIGARMGKVTTKCGIVTVLSKFNLVLCDEELKDSELVFEPTQFNLTPKKLFNIKLIHR